MAHQELEMDFAVAQIRGSGFVAHPFRGSSGYVLLLGFTSAAVLLLLATSWMQAQSVPASNSAQKNKPTVSPVSPATPQEVARPPVVPPLPPPSVEQKPPEPPTVAWDGKQLTIDAENSTLAAVLGAVRERTGASIEIPGVASAERVFVHLGPGPARDIISALLYGTSFDYILQAADDDPDILRSVVLTARGQSDSSSEVVVAGTTNSGGGSGGGGSTVAADTHRGGAPDGRIRPEGVRMMPGWASPSKPSFQVDAEAALAAEQAAEQDAAAAHDSAAAQESAAGAVAGAGTRASNSPPSTSDSNDQSGVGQAIQSMTRMFEQRRQIQAQQNQPPPPSSN